MKKCIICSKDISLSKEKYITCSIKCYEINRADKARNRRKMLKIKDKFIKLKI